MSMHLAKLGQANRQLAVGMQIIFVNEHMSWTVHRLKANLLSSTSVKYMFS